MKLGSSQLAVLNHLTKYAYDSAMTVGIILYDRTSACARPARPALDRTKTAWAGKILRSLFRKGLVERAGQNGVYLYAVTQQGKAALKEQGK